MACTKEEIEKKRLAALEKRQNKLFNNSISSTNSPLKGSPGSTRGSQLLGFGAAKTSHLNLNRSHPYAQAQSNTSGIENKVPVGKVVSGTVYLISEDRFEVKPSEFCTPLINIFKSLPSKSYDTKSKLWNFSIHDYQELVSKVAPLAPHVVLGPIPSYVLKILRESTTDPNSIDLSPIEATLRNKLMPFQEDGVRFGISRRGRCMIADDMGLGKTFQALAIASYYKHNWPLLIVTTSSMRHEINIDSSTFSLKVPNDFQVDVLKNAALEFVAPFLLHQRLGSGGKLRLSRIIIDVNKKQPCDFGFDFRETWQSKIHELLPSVPLMNIVTLTSGKDSQLVADKQTEVVIVSYKITSMHTDLLKSKKFGVVIIDESHYLKSHKAQCTLALGGITRKCTRAILLSGTPALSRPSELFTQLSLIEPGLFPSYTEFGKRYCDGKQTNFGWDMTGQSNLAELQIILQKRFLIRRTKEQVLTKLEEKTRETVILDETILKFDQEEEKGLSQMAETYKSSNSSDKHSALITFFSESARVKIPAICKYIRQLLEDGKTDKFLVFAHHKPVIEAICLTLDEAGVHYICIVGSTPANTRADLVDKFQHTPSCRCAVLSVTAANSGLTLTAASLVLFAELHWNPGILTQAEARAHRIGQRGSVCVRYLLAHRTADDYMWPMLQNKLNVLNNVGLSRDTFEDTTMKHQDSQNKISQYLSAVTPKNKNDYIPGTNIRKDSLNSNTSSIPAKQSTSNSDDAVDKSFLDDDEDDELMANLDL